MSKSNIEIYICLYNPIFSEFLNKNLILGPILFSLKFYDKMRDKATRTLLLKIFSFSCRPLTLLSQIKFLQIFNIINNIFYYLRTLWDSNSQCLSLLIEGSVGFKPTCGFLQTDLQSVLFDHSSNCPKSNSKKIRKD